MPNSFFKFKQFTVYQDKCAMKVCTDACLFGSIAANTIYNSLSKIRNCLDIGSGTGLLSLMIIQKNPAIKIDAVEIDEDAARQTKENFLSSQWSSQLNVINDDAKNYLFDKKFDFIFSNPPFFENDLKSNQSKRNTALHSTDLDLNGLVYTIKNNLADTGSFTVLLPFHRTEYFEKLCNENQFYCNQKFLVKQTPGHNFFRSILFFSKANESFQTKEIIIKNSINQYSNEFKNLLGNYYLNIDKA